MKKFSLFIAVGMLTLSLGSCDKSEPVTNGQDENTTIVADEGTTEEVGTEVDAIVDEALTLSSSIQLKSATESDTLNYLTATCPIITLDTINTTKVLTIDFGTSCTGKDGKVRAGKIIVTCTNLFRLNVTRTCTFDNYTVDGKIIKGTINKTITRLISAKSRQATISENISVTFPNDGGTAYRKAELTRIYFYGWVDLLRDDKITTWGTVEFTRINGNKITKTIDVTTPLVYKIVCRQIVSGTQVITRSDKKTLTINYGDGTCDREATVTDGISTWTIKL